MANLQKIKELANERNLSLHRLANELNMATSTLSAMIKSGSTSTKTLEAIAAVLGVPVSVFFDDTPSVSVSSVGDGNNIVGRGNIENARDIGKALDILNEQLRTKDRQIEGLIVALQKQP
jgi:transcriptional regulator with XRE-family HTH domain